MYLGNMLWKGNGFTSLQVWTNTVAGHSGKYTTSTYAQRVNLPREADSHITLSDPENTDGY